MNAAIFLALVELGTALFKFLKQWADVSAMSPAEVDKAFDAARKLLASPETNVDKLPDA